MNELKREIRILALKLLYEQEFHHQSIKRVQKNSVSKSVFKNSVAQKNAMEIVNNIQKTKKTIDDLIKKTSHYWSLERMSLIDLNIMRIAIYEMIYASPTIPFKVCINEALEISKIYGTEDSSSFINGVLDKISKNIENPSSKDSKTRNATHETGKNSNS